MSKNGLLVASLLLVSTPAQAKVLELYAQAEGGGAGGKGLKGDLKDSAFQDRTSGGAYGILVGAEVVFLDGWISHTQYRDSDGLAGTWTTFMAGFDFDFALDDAPPGKKHHTFGEFGTGVGFGVGTGQQVDPPLDNAQVSDKGFLAQVSFGGDYRFNDVMSIGLTVPITWAYMFKNDVANDTSNQYQAIDIAALLHLRFRIEAL